MEDSPTLDAPRPSPDRTDRARHPEQPDRAAAVRAIAGGHLDERGPLLPILHEVVDRLGWVADEDVPVIADVLNLSRADVHGVVSFYADFRTTAPADHRIALCRAEACQAVGAQGLYATTREHFGDAEDVEVDEVFCLGNCALGPSGTIDGRLHGRLSSARIVELTQEWAR
jgi:formate dehydrogenase subunit gamma